MVHNGIEYADMQFIAEAYDLMQNVCGFTNKEMAAVFDRYVTLSKMAGARPCLSEKTLEGRQVIEFAQATSFGMYCCI
eukprot:4583587-Pyramimonas_sp.AAC.1